MATTPMQTIDVTQALADLLSGVADLRVYWYVADTVRPPACVIGQPDIDYTDGGTGFCSAAWSVPLTLVVSRSNDRASQTQMSQLLSDVVNALATDVPGVFSVEPQNARPIQVTVSGQDLPGYLLNIRVRA